MIGYRNDTMQKEVVFGSKSVKMKIEAVTGYKKYHIYSVTFMARHPISHCKSWYTMFCHTLYMDDA